MLLFGLAAILILFTVLWVVSLRLENSSVADVAWGPAILVIGLTYYFTSDGGGSIRAYVTLALLALWAARLSVHLGMRTRLQGEDFRYVKWRDDYDPWWLVSYFKVFLFQAVAAWLVSLPIYFAVVSPAPASLTLTDYFGILLVVCGLAIETLGDEQLRRFRANRANRGKVLDTGLWQYTRHPNYFGEAVLWWGFGLISLATGGVPGLVGSAILTYLLIYVSGIRLLEATLIEKPGYIQYVGRTPGLVPLPPQVRIQVMAKLRELQKKREPVRPKRRY